MSENYDRSTPAPGDQESLLARLKYYPPPEDADRYASRALPPPPPFVESRPISYSWSSYSFEDDYAGPHTLLNPLAASDENHDHSITTFASLIDENALAMVQPSRITIPTYPQPDEHQEVVSPRPQRPDSRLISIWAKGDELVSPVDTPGTASWRNHIVSPLSDTYPAAMEESWFDDTSSDEGAQPGPSNPTTAEESQSIIRRFSVSEGQLPRNNFRYSDPGSPLSPSFDLELFGESGPDVGRGRYIDDVSGRRTVQPQVHYSNGGEQSYLQGSNAYVGAPKISFAVPKIDSFSSVRPTAGQRPVPPPLKLGGRSAQEEFVKTPFPPRPDSVPSERMASGTDEQNTGGLKRRSGLGRFGSLRRRSSRQNSPKPPPGFTEILSQLDKHGVVSPNSRAKGILSKAKQGLGIGSDEPKREKGRNEY
ncbi:hypothetical protein GGR55DRAFT_37681 [Xylaria sp. FL0064]|nr:hypothetical protein GGR55DRAFT_37681 [Xylaria sp. FL0064]